MRSAMPRFLTVNGFSSSPPVRRGNQGLNSDPDPAAELKVGVEPGSYGVESAAYGIEPSPAGIEPAGYDVERSPYGVSSTRYGAPPADRKSSGDQGPCLYFGPQGQRCDRPAIANGFCARHLPAHLDQAARFGATSPAQTATASPSSKPYAGVPSPGFERYGGLPSPGSKPFARIVAVGIAIFAALWPVIADLLREILRWIRAH